jgi:hypothetical protein
MPVSFYNLDYLIEINQKRLEDYNSSMQKVLEKLTHIILIYSGLGIFLVSLIQHVMDADIDTALFYVFFSIFSGLIVISLVYFIRLLLPAEIACLDPPEVYYKNYRAQMELGYPSDQETIDDSLKGAYILELESAIYINNQIYSRKNSFYYRALIFALLAVIPYIFCLGFHLSKKDDKIQKIELVGKKS